MRELTAEEIEEFACRPSCNKKVVTDYLNDLKNLGDVGMWTAIGKVRSTANNSGWNTQTADAIVAGVKLAYAQ